MPPKKIKKSQAAKNVGDQSDSDSEPMVTDEVKVEFEALPVAEGDRGGIVALLNQLFGKGNVGQAALADLIISQSPLGCVLTPSEEQGDMEVDDVVYGIVSVFRLHQDVSGELVKVLKEKCKKHASPTVLKTLMAVLQDSSSSSVGVIVNERFVNIPHQIALPSFQSLREDMKNGGENFSFSDYILIMKIQKCGVQGKKKNMEEGDVIFVNAEEELLSQESDVHFDFPVSGGEERGERAETDDGVLLPFRRVILFSDSVFEKFLGKLENVLKE